jgi:Tfp pilus assembly protein PilZ
MGNEERRVYKRISIAGAKAHYQLENGETGSSRIENLTKNSVCIQLKQRILVGQPIDLELTIPGKPTVQVKAKIVWVLPRGGFDAGSIVGIKFRPYGEETNNNSFETKKVMETIVESFRE